MSKSIVTKYLNQCLICQNLNVEIHHALYGNKHKLADKDKLLMPLCPSHHNSSKMSVHMNKEMKVLSQCLAQACWERHYLAQKLANINKDEINDQTVDDWLEEARDAFFKRYGEYYL